MPSPFPHVVGDVAMGGAAAPGALTGALMPTPAGAPRAHYMGQASSAARVPFPSAAPVGARAGAGTSMGGGPFRAPLPPSNAPRRRNSMLPPVPAMTPRVTQGAGAAAAARPGFAASESE